MQTNNGYAGGNGGSRICFFAGLILVILCLCSSADCSVSEEWVARFDGTAHDWDEIGDMLVDSDGRWTGKL